MSLAQLFDQKRSELLKQYDGQFVWFENGEVLDIDPDQAALVIRAFSKTDPRPLLIKKVLPEDPKPIVRTPFYP
jgi:hypothetical protein